MNNTRSRETAICPYWLTRQHCLEFIMRPKPPDTLLAIRMDQMLHDDSFVSMIQHQHATLYLLRDPKGGRLVTKQEYCIEAITEFARRWKYDLLIENKCGWRVELVTKEGGCMRKMITGIDDELSRACELALGKADPLWSQETKI